MFLQALMHVVDMDQLESFNQDTYLTLPFHFYWKDLHGKYIGCNDTQARFAGLEKGSDLLGCTDFDMCWSAYAPTYQYNDQSIINKNQAKLLIEPILDPNLHSCMMLSYKFPWRKRNKMKGVIGASFFFEKNELFGDLLKCVDTENASQASYLTKRQTDCLYYLIKGMTTKQIAKQMDLSPRTVEHYLESLKEKLDCINRADLIEKGLRLTTMKYRLLTEALT